MGLGRGRTKRPSPSYLLRSVMAFAAVLAGLALLLLLQPASAECVNQVPVNDCFANAIPYDPFSPGQDTTGATLELGEPTPCPDMGPTVWYVWVPNGPGIVTMDTVGSSYETVLATYWGDELSALHQFGCDFGGEEEQYTWGDDSTWDLYSELTFSCLPGEPIYIQVAGYQGATGWLDLNINGCLPDVPPSVRIEGYSADRPCATHVWKFEAIGSPSRAFQSWAWDFGDGTTGTGRVVQHAFIRSGTTMVSVSAVGPRGTANDTRPIPVDVAPSCPPTLEPFPDAVVYVGDSIQSCASAQAGQGGPLEYSVELPPGASWEGQCMDWRPSEAGTYRCIRFTVTESPTGLTAAQCLHVRVFERPTTVVDSDGDGIADAGDVCPAVADLDQKDSDGDGVGDACETCVDGSGVPSCPADQTARPARRGATIRDGDLDGAVDSRDNCPTIPNTDQTDLDGDSFGDACDADVDGDGVADGLDNCPTLANPAQGSCVPAGKAPVRQRALAQPQGPAGLSLVGLSSMSFGFLLVSGTLTGIAWAFQRRS